jgi:hypothetical protein
MWQRKLNIERLEDRRVLAADFNGDETVDEFDLRDWTANFGSTSATSEQGDADGDADVDGSDVLQWQRDLGPIQNNLIAYRPQSVYNPNAVETPAPIYDTFPKRPVSAQDETSNTLGPGIRINHDDDNNSGLDDWNEIGFPVIRENDLIEVKVDRLPGQGDLLLVADGQLSLFYNHDKEGPIPANTPLPFVNDTITVWVEWMSPNHGFANLSLFDAATQTTQDTVRFHSFRSVIVTFGGLGQDPADTDGDGSIGDLTEPGNREGIFDIAQTMYNTGWDVLAFNEEDVDHPDQIPYWEIKTAREERFVQRHAVIGYSQGGGATHDLIQNMFTEDGDGDGDIDEIFTNIGVFLDAVQHDFPLGAPETDWPDVALYLLNIYQERSVLRGGDINDNEVWAGLLLEEVNTTTDPGWDNALDHFDIDDDPQIQQLIRTRLQQELINR